MKKFLNWLFPSYENDLSVFLSSIVAITLIVLLTDEIPDNLGKMFVLLLFIPFIFVIAITHKLLVKLFRKILGENNKHIGRGSVFALIIIFIVINAIID